MENKQEWKVNVVFMVLFLILKALVCPELGMERGVIFQMLLVPYQHLFQLENTEQL